MLKPGRIIDVVQNKNAASYNGGVEQPHGETIRILKRFAERESYLVALEPDLYLWFKLDSRDLTNSLPAELN